MANNRWSNSTVGRWTESDYYFNFEFEVKNPDASEEEILEIRLWVLKQLEHTLGVLSDG